jgi:hypothetical protein
MDALSSPHNADSGLLQSPGQSVTCDQSNPTGILSRNPDKSQRNKKEMKECPDGSVNTRYPGLVLCSLLHIAHSLHGFAATKQKLPSVKPYALTTCNQCPFGSNLSTVDEQQPSGLMNTQQKVRTKQH